jgi:peptidoglycan/LPS O-acetylase OafA/YrhL
MTQMTKTQLLSFAGVLAILASFGALAVGLVAFWAAQMSLSYRYGLGFNYAYYLVMGVLGVASYTVGVVAGVYIRRRKRQVFCFSGLGLLVACGGVMSYPIWVFGLPIIAVALLSAVLVFVCRSEFADKQIASPPAPDTGNPNIP